MGKSVNQKVTSSPLPHAAALVRGQEPRLIGHAVHKLLVEPVLQPCGVLVEPAANLFLAQFDKQPFAVILDGGQPLVLGLRRMQEKLTHS
ncbi:hypothetical protein D3C84_1111170 [compost metagenome]